MPHNENVEFIANPFALFDEWLQLATIHEMNDPNAMSLATCTPDGKPSVRIVLLKGHEANGFRFYTHSTSRKGQELLANPQAAICFHWKSLQRQIRIEGLVELLNEKIADDYFAGRPRMSQIGAWASAQSEPLANKQEFAAAITRFREKFENLPVPRPPQWRGFNIVPETIEFWAEQPYRLHDRMLYRRAADNWQQQRLYP